MTPEEQSIFQTILTITRIFGLNSQFRVAGGWVRDKLLGKQSDDLDIAIDNMTGRQFEKYIATYGKQNPNSGVGKSYTVGETPGVKLETVAVELFGRKIDFINLRSESYGDTRIPEMQFGTPEIDAQRRDLTINSLFYNIGTGEIEDYVGGLKDLETMTLRTPLDPLKTFSDDPLRMLRVLRFFSRYPNATIDPALVGAMKNPVVHEAYRQKVASERAGPEILKLMAGEKPADALKIMFDTGLDKAIFDLPEINQLNDLRMDQRNSHHKHNLLDHTLLVVQNMHNLLKQENAPEEIRVKMLLASLFHDYGKAHPEIAQPKKSDPTQMSYIGHEDKSAEIAEAAMKAIAIPDNDRKFVNKVIQLHMRPHLHANEEWTPKMIGRFMRETEIPGQESSEIWRYVMLHSMADTLSKDSANPDYADLAQKQQHVELMRNFKARPGPSVNKPLLNGNDLMQMFPSLKVNTIIDGKNFIKEIGEKLLDEQASGSIASKEQAVSMVEGMRALLEQKFAPNRTSAWLRDNCKFSAPVEKDQVDLT